MGQIWQYLALGISRALLFLRYRVDLNIPEDLGTHEGALICPTHMSLTDPWILNTMLWRHLRQRPVVLEGIYRMPGLNGVMKLIDAFPIDQTGDGGGDWRKWKIKRQMQAAHDARARGDSLLVYPSGRIRLDDVDELGANAMCYDLVQASPDKPVLMVRIRGLGRSWFSTWYLGKSPLSAEAKTFLRSVWENKRRLLRRTRVIIDVDVMDNPAQYQNALAFNRALTDWYRGVTEEFEEGCIKVVDRKESVDDPHANVTLEPVVIARVQELIAKQKGASARDVRPDRSLAELDFDSLDNISLKLLVAEEFDVEIDEESQFETVRDVVLGGMGLLRDTSTVEATNTPTAWIESDRKGIAFPSAPPNIVQAILKTAKRMGGRAVACGSDTDGVMTYDQLWKHIFTFVYIIRHQYSRHEYIGVMFPASPWAMIVENAVRLAGKIPVQINWLADETAIDHMVDLSEIQVILSAEAFLNRAESLMSDRVMEMVLPIESFRRDISIWKLLKWQRKASSLVKLTPEDVSAHFDYYDEPDDTAVILFTSGSTKLPKGVILSHRNMLTVIAGSEAVIQGVSGDVMYSFLPPPHAFGNVQLTVLPFVIGLKVVFHPNPRQVKHLAHGLEKWCVTLCPGLPDLVKAIITHAGEEGCGTVRYFMVGGVKVSGSLRDTVQGMGKELLDGYGQTELSPLCTLTVPGEPAVGVGKPLPSVKILILDPDGNVVSDGNDGDIVVHGDNIAKGYLGDIPLSTTMFGDDRYLVTGDIGHLKDGNLILTDRRERIVNRGGENVSLAVLEEPLEAHWPKVDGQPAVAVHKSGIGDGESKEVIYLFTTDAAIDKREANGILKEAGVNRLARIDEVIVVDSIPVSAIGKIIHSKLPLP